MKSLIKYLMAISLALFGIQAHALTLVPGGEIDSGNDTSASVIDAYITSTYGVDQYYKSESGVGGEETGEFAGSYNTTFSNTATDPSDALIEYTGGTSISCPECYLLVKDGNADPAWYLFDIGSWNGTDDIILDGFWDGVNGAISHVALYGTPGQVPEPAPLALLAAGLMGLGLRRFTRKS